MPNIDYSQLRAEVTIGQVLELLRFEPRSKTSDQLRGPCPIHGSSSPTSRIFSVSLSRNMFKCFKCDAHGNQLDLWCQVHKLSLYVGVLDLCQKLGIDPPTLSLRS